MACDVKACPWCQRKECDEREGDSNADSDRD